MRALAALLTMLLLAALLMVGAAKLYLWDQKRKKQQAPADANATYSNKQAIDTTAGMLLTGDVVLRRGTGTFSMLLANLNRRDKTYSHCGIVIREHGWPFVYHCIGGEGDAQPCIRRDSAQNFFSPNYNTDIAVVRYAIADSILQSIPAYVQKWRSLRPTFDTHFDLGSDSALYCTEFVYKVITAATADSAYLPHSLITGHRFVGTDDLFLNTHARLIWRVRFK